MALTKKSLISVNGMHSFVLSDLGLKRLEVGSLKLIDLLCSLVELEGWHAGDTTSLGSLCVCINIDLHELQGGLDTGELLKLWGDHLAWWAPCGGEVNDGKSILLEGLIEFSFGGELLDHCCF